MTDIEVTSTCEEGYTANNVIDDEWELTVDALEEDGPSAQQVLVADYASCYLPALRVAADQTGYDDIGEIEIDVEADLDEDDDVSAIRFDLRVEADLGDDERKSSNWARRSATSTTRCARNSTPTSRSRAASRPVRRTVFSPFTSTERRVFGKR